MCLNLGRSKFWIIPIVFVLSVLSCSPQADQSHADEHEHGHHDHDQASEDPLTVECEHDMPAYQCDACRFEVGVVKVDPRLLNLDEGETSQPMVKTVPVAQVQLQKDISVTGEIALNSNLTAHVNSAVAGRVRDVNTDLGDEVKRGDVLFTVDSVELGHGLNEYRKNLALMALAQRSLDRERSLFQQKIASERDVIEAQMKYEELRNAFNASKHALTVLGMTHGQLAGLDDQGPTNASSLEIRAPIDGTIVQQHVVTGEQIRPDDSVIVISDLDKVWAWFSIYERDLATLLKKRADDQTIPLTLHVEAFPEQAFRGSIDYIGATMDEATRTIKVRAAVDNATRLLRPGMFCSAKISADATTSVLAIPEGSLLSDEGQTFVFKHMNGGMFIRQNVQTGENSKGLVEIREGLTRQDMIVVDGGFLLKSDVLREKMGAGCAD